MSVSNRLFPLLCLAALDLSGQTSLSGTLECPPPSVRGALEVGDRPDHALILSERQCRWSQPLTIAGAVGRDARLTLLTDARADGVRDRGYNVFLMSNGDRIFMHWFTESGGGNFALSGGTGQFLGIYGSGSLTWRRSLDGSLTVRLQGSCTIPKR